MKIAGFLRTSLIEWPGKICAVIFTPGCNFRCPFCHNPDLVDPPRVNKAELFEKRLVLDDLRARKEWLDGVAVTGGEPTLQPDLADFFREVREIGFKTMLETNGSRPEAVESLLQEKLIDYLGLDYKTRLADYPGLVRSEENGLKTKIRQVLEILRTAQIAFEVRTTVVPTLHDEAKIKSMAQELVEILGKEKAVWYLQEFRPKNCLDQGFEKIAPYGQKTMKAFTQTAQEFYPNVKLRTA